MTTNGKNAPLVSAAIIARNSKDDLRRLLYSLAKPLSSMTSEIILIDNASTDNTAEMIRNEFPMVKMTVNRGNKGVAPARNQALQQCRGKFIFILDADCEYIEGELREAMSYLDENPKVGVLGFRVYYPNGELQDTARTLPTPCDLFINRLDDSEMIQASITFKRHRMRDFNPMKIREAGFVAGACQFFPKSILDEVGYLDERMFYGYEDSDFCARVIMKGKKVVYYPHIVVVHHHQRLTKKKPISVMTLVQVKSYIFFLRKHGAIINKINRDLFENNTSRESVR